MEGPILFPLILSAQASCLNGLIGTGQRQFWCHPHTYVPVLPPRGIVLGILGMFRRYVQEHTYVCSGGPVL